MSDQRPNWVKAVGVASEISSWIIVPIVLALVMGKYLDNRFGTEPKIFIVLAAVGFLTTIYGIVKVVKEFKGKING